MGAGVRPSLLCVFGLCDFGGPVRALWGAQQYSRPVPTKMPTTPPSRDNPNCLLTVPDASGGKPAPVKDP